MTKEKIQQLVGIFGGTFDPIHNGHLRLMIELSEQLPFSEIRVLPCHTPALKTTSYASPEHRLNMLRLATRSLNQIIIDDRELKRTGVSYTYDSLVSIREEIGNKPLALIIGTDAFLGFDKWYRWQEIMKLSNILIVARPNYTLPSSGVIYDLLQKNLTQDIQDFYKTSVGKIMICPIPLLAISATDIRRRIAEHLSIRYLVPDTILEYIVNEKIYLT